MNKAEVCEQIKKIGIIPAIRVSSAEEAHFAADAVAEGGIPIVEITMTVPQAVELISHLVRDHDKLIVGAGTVLAEMPGRGRPFFNGARVRSGDCGICRESKRYRVSRCIHADRSGHRVAMRFGFHQSISVRACRAQIHQVVEDSIASDSIDRCRRHNSTDRREFYFGGSNSDWSRNGLDPFAGHRAP